MLQEPMRTIGFFCPDCRNAVVIERSSFQLAASHSQVDCPCGKSSLQLSLQNDKIKLEAPCLLCEQSHSLSCSAHAFLHERIIAFSCGASGLDCCYVGESGPVFAAMERLEETIDGLMNEHLEPGMFLNDIVMEEILEELRDIGQREAIFCSCGGRSFSLRVNFSAVELSCASCGGSMKIPAATGSDIEDLCCKTSLQIRGRKP